MQTCANANTCKNVRRQPLKESNLDHLNLGKFKRDKVIRRSGFPRENEKKNI